MANGSMTIEPLPGANSGRLIRLPGAADAAAKIAAAEAEKDALLDAFLQSRGLLVVPGMGSINDQLELLVRLSNLFGPEVEDYHQTLTERGKLHDSVAEILVVSNMAPSSTPPPNQPEPPLAEDGGFPVQFSQRRDWHTDQSFRRPPPGCRVVLCGHASAQGPGPDPLRRRHRRLREPAGRLEETH